MSNVTNQLHECHGLANTGTTEQTNLAALGDRHDQVDNLDARFQELGRCRLLFVRRGSAVNRHVHFGANVAGIVDRPAKHVHDSAQRLLTNRHSNRAARVSDAHAAFQAFRRTHCNGADNAIAQLLLNFERNARLIDDECVVNFGDLARRELNVHNSANNLHSSSSAH